MKTITQQLNAKDFPYIIKDKDGNQTYYEDTYGFWNKREFDKNGNQTYYEDSTGYWDKREYDSNSNQTYFKISTSGVIIDNRPKTNSEFLPNPFASKNIIKTIAQQLSVTDFPFRIRDKNGKETYHEDSDGYWFKREFDKNGKQTYYEISTGYWIKREFDSNGNQIYFEDSHGGIIDNRQKNTFTIKEFADKLGVAVETLQIKD